MSELSQPLPGAERIRALQDDGAVFHAFDAYPWTKDKMFMSGLYAILGEPHKQNPQASLADMAIHARIFYYAQRIGVNIDFAKYQSWLAEHPDHQAPDILPQEYLSSQTDGAAQGDVPVLEWQKAAPRADLYVDRKAVAETAPDDQPNYPMGFAEMLKLLQEGKPIPGIRQIPNTIARDPSVKPVGTKAAPKKPWEKDVAAPVLDSSIPKALDADFPPAEIDGPGSP